MLSIHNAIMDPTTRDWWKRHDHLTNVTETQVDWKATHTLCTTFHCTCANGSPKQPLKTVEWEPHLLSGISKTMLHALAVTIH